MTSEEPDVDESKEWQDLEGIEQEIYPDDEDVLEDDELIEEDQDD